MTALVWLRHDLRLHDNPALHAAHALGLPTYVIYIHDTTAPWSPGAASRWWLHHSLQSLSKSLNGQLNVYQGDSTEVMTALCKRLGVTHVFWNRRYTAHGIEHDTLLKARLTEFGMTVASSNGTLLQEPWGVNSKSGTPFKVFTPFWNTLKTLPMRPALPTHVPPLKTDASAQPLKALGLLPTVPWDNGLTETWTPGEAGAEAGLSTFLDQALSGYATLRDRPDKAGTSRLSPHLAFGEISPIRLWHRLQQEVEKHPRLAKDADRFLSELAWREFSAHLLYRHPTLPTEPLRPEFGNFPWRQSYEDDLRLWQKGQTGLPIVDAGMRELWHTGYMHNRVRMIVASVLIKNMLIPWQKGEEWFWDTLVDADLANNSASWQWVAGCGADAAPYFRIFNPLLQGQKFDPDGTYVRRWVPELTKLSGKHIHAPWQAPHDVLRAADIALGRTYPRPCLDLQTTRARALEAFSQIKSTDTA